MFEDFFIPVRRLYARVAQHYAIRTILSTLASVNAIVQVIKLVDESSDSEKGGEKPSQRVRELLLMIEEKMRDAQDSSIEKSSILMGELQAYRRQLASVSYGMRNGWTK